MDISSETICAVFYDSDLEHNDVLDGSPLHNTLKTMEHNPEKFYLLTHDSKYELHEAVEAISETLKKHRKDYKVELTRIRFAKEMKFSLPVFFGTGEEQRLYTLSELLERLNSYEAVNLDSRNIPVIIDDDGIEENSDHDDQASLEVVRLFQQLVYLNLNLDIKKKSELHKSRVKERFRKMHKELQAEAEARRDELDTLLAEQKISEESAERLQRMSESLSAMLKAFDEGKVRTLKIAAMGTKKAGKSVIINSILGRDYAPTSSELPTPNVVRYIPCPESIPLTLEYMGNAQAFETPEALSSYILEEFRKAQKKTGEGSELEDMTIYYPSDEYTGYEVIDTPGPNFAGAGTKHYEIARKCIEEADICIFVMNYSTHLSDDEEKFLKEIRDSFAQHGKFYSLFIAVNRIDERYSSTVEKSVCRLVDYIRSRLVELGYKNVILFGTSALQSFYLDKITSLMKNFEIYPDDNKPFAPKLERFDYEQAYAYTEDDLNTELEFLTSSIRRLERFHGISSPTPSDIRNFSGIPQMERHLQYIGGTKVDTEIVYNVITRCDACFADIKNALIVADLLRFSDEDKKALAELGRMMIVFKYKVENIINSVKDIGSEKNIAPVLLRIMKAIEDNKRQVMNDVDASCRRAVDSTTVTEDDVKHTISGKLTSGVKEIKKKIAEAVVMLAKRSSEVMESTAKKETERYSRDVESSMQKARKNILGEFEDVRIKVDNPSVMRVIDDFRLPDFPPTLRKMHFSGGTFEAKDNDTSLQEAAKDSHRKETTYHEETTYTTVKDSKPVKETKYKTETITKTRTVTVQREARGFWENIRSFFGKKYYEEREEQYQEQIRVPYEEIRYVEETRQVPTTKQVKGERDVYDVARFKQIITSNFQKQMRDMVERELDKISEAVHEVVKDIYADISRQCVAINSGFEANVDNLIKDIDMTIDSKNKHMQALLNDIAVLDGIAENFSAFFNMWGEVLTDNDRRQ